MGRVASAVWLAVLLGSSAAIAAGDAPLDAAPSLPLTPVDGAALALRGVTRDDAASERAVPASDGGAPGRTSGEADATELDRAAAASPEDARTSAPDAKPPGDAAGLVGATAHPSPEDGRTSAPDAGTPGDAASPGAAGDVVAPEGERATGTAALANRPGRGLLTHDEYRYGQRWNLPVGLLLRPFMDLVAIPSGVVAWDGRDWGTFAAAVGVVTALSLPLGPSPDVLLQRKLQAALGGENHFRLWTKYGDFAIWFALYASLASTFLYGLVEGQPAFVEAPALAIEAFLVMQVYHWGLKALTGRDGPDRNVVPGQLTSDGTYHGPAGFVDPYGSGTPSGHVASVYAIFSVLMHYFDTPALWIGLHLAGALFSLTIIADNYHFASEVILGAAMGYCVGRWVVEHRSSRYRNDDGGLPRRVWNTVKAHTSLAPALLPGGGVGATVMLSWD